MAKARKMTMKEYEGSAEDRKSDRKALAAHNRRAKKSVAKDQPKGGKQKVR